MEFGVPERPWTVSKILRGSGPFCPGLGAGREDDVQRDRA